MLHGEQVSLRPMERADIPRLWEFAQDMNLGLVTGADGRPTPLAAIERVYEDHWSGLDPTAVRWGVEAHETLIGGAELSEIDWRNRSATLIAWIGDTTYRRRGCGSDALRLALNYAFKLLGLNRVSYAADGTNEAILGCYYKVGFVEEGRQRKAIYRDGRYHDVVMLSLLREEWTDTTPLQAAMNGEPAEANA